MPPGSAANRARSPQLATHMPDGPSWKAPGPTAIPPRGAATGHSDSKNNPRLSRISAGKPKAGWANAPATWGPEANMPTASPSLWPVNSRASCGPLPNSFRLQHKPRRTVYHWPLNVERFQRASEEAPPRCGVTLGSVKRLIKDTRAESEAGTRRRQGRWEPSHESQRDQPSSFTGSASADALRTKNIMMT